MSTAIRLIQMSPFASSRSASGPPVVAEIRSP